jgi:hypothetical protein
MRELQGYHGEHRRHAPDATAATDAPGRHARDRAHDAPKFKVLLDPEARKAEHLRYRKAVEAAYEPKHAADQLKPHETKPEHAPPDARDKPAAGIARRRLEESNQAGDVARREKPRFMDKALNFWTAASGFALTMAAEQFHLIPPGLASEISKAIEVAALGIIWRQGERTENRDGNRPKD